jgi:hypothetical protein
MKRLEFLEKARNTHGYKYNYLNLSEKVTLNDRIEIEYNGDIYMQSISKHLMGRCPEKSIKRKTNEEFIIESKKIWGNKYDYSLVDYKGALSNVKIVYDGIVYEQRAQSHLEGLAPEFRKNEDSKLKEVIKAFDLIGENEIKLFLEKYNIDFINSYRESSIEFDFYLPKLRTVVEFDGRQHFEPIDEFGGMEFLDRVKKEDVIKENYCEDNFINLIRIKYDQFDDIYQILYNNLKNYIRK